MSRSELSIKQFHALYPTEEACFKAILKLSYPDGLKCLKCQKAKLYRLKNERAFACSSGHQLYPLANTIFARSTTPLKDWFLVIYLMAGTRSGVSAKHVQRILGNSYKTSWRLCHQVRSLMAEDGALEGTVEVDETYFQPNIWKSSKAFEKYRLGSGVAQIVIGMVERGGAARLKHIQTNSAQIMLSEIEGTVRPNSRIYTDQFPAYKGLTRMGYAHDTVLHKREHVRGDVHTQYVDSLWGEIKRGVKGVYRHVEPIYLQAYLNEYAYRYSHRNDEVPIFFSLLGRISPV